MKRAFGTSTRFQSGVDALVGMAKRARFATRAAAAYAGVARAAARRRAGSVRSRTVTRTKTKRARKGSRRVRRRPGKSYKRKDVTKIVQTQRNYTNGAGNSSCAAGFQQIATVTDMIGALNNASLYSPPDILNLLKQFSGVDQLTRKIIVDKAKWHATVRNASTVEDNCVFYFCRPRLGGGLPNSGTPIGAYTSGEVDAGVVGAWSYVGSTPFDSPKFRQAWKVVKTVRKVLEPGELLHLRYTDARGFMVDEERSKDQPYYMDRSLWVLCVHYGGVDKGTTSNVVTTGACELIWTVNKEYFFRQMDSSYVNDSFVNQLPGGVAQGAAQTIEVMTGIIAGVVQL